MPDASSPWKPADAIAAAQAANEGLATLPPAATIWSSFTAADKVAARKSVTNLLAATIGTVRENAEMCWKATRLHRQLHHDTAPAIQISADARRLLHNSIMVLGELGASYEEICTATALCPQSLLRLCTLFPDIRDAVIAASVLSPDYWRRMREDLQRKVIAGEADACILLFSDRFTLWREADVRDDYETFLLLLNTPS